MEKSFMLVCWKRASGVTPSKFSGQKKDKVLTKTPITAFS